MTTLSRRDAGLVLIVGAWLHAACGRGASPSTPAAPSTPAPAATAVVAVTFSENPVPFRSTGCSFSTPQGWFTDARIQETAGVAVTVTTLLQKLDGSPSSLLSESFNSRFGACAGSTFTPGSIPASGAVCGTVGVCATGPYSTYQFSIAGTDANGHSINVDSPILRFSPP